MTENNDDFTEHSRNTSLKQALESLLHNIDPTGEKSNIQTRLTKAWEEITGPSTLEHTVALFQRGDTIVVWVDDATWASNIRMLESMYLEKISEALGDPTLRRVRVEVRRRKK